MGREGVKDEMPNMRCKGVKCKVVRWEGVKC